LIRATRGTIETADLDAIPHRLNGSLAIVGQVGTWPLEPAAPSRPVETRRPGGVEADLASRLYRPTPSSQKQNTPTHYPQKPVVCLPHNPLNCTIVTETRLVGAALIRSAKKGRWLWLSLLLLVTTACSSSAQPAEPPAAAVPEHVWPTFPLLDSTALTYERDIRGFEVSDSLYGHPTAEVVVTGSSSIVSWKSMATDLAPLQAANRGFGGSTLLHCAYFAHRYLFPLQPKLVVIYAGENDVAYAKGMREGQLDSLPLLSLQQFTAHLHEALPEAHLLYISMKPSPARAKLWPRFQKGNALIQEWVKTDPRLGYIDVTTAMLDAQGQPKAEIFKKDKLHMNEQGYALWTPIVRKAMEDRLQIIHQTQH
jgi:hypothetical protein